MAGRAAAAARRDGRHHRLAAHRVDPRRATAAGRSSEHDLVRLFRARGDEFCRRLRGRRRAAREVNGDVISYVVTRNINYTNVCYFKCQFCAFSKGKLSENLRGRPYTLPLDEIARRAREAWDRGATEVCMQGGIEPDSPARPISRSARRFARPCPACTSTRSRRSKCIRAPRRSVSRSASSCDAESRRPRHAARHRRRDSR